MERLSIQCKHCGSNDFDVTYGSGGIDNSWSVHLECNGCGHITLVAVTPKEDRTLSIVNEKRDFYAPMTKVDLSWHEREGHKMIQKETEDWLLAEKYQKQHSPYNKKDVIIVAVWRDQNAYLCVQYETTFGRQLDWFHYTVNNGELEWW